MLKKYLSLPSAMVTLALAYGIDRWLAYQAKLASRTLYHVPLLAWTLVSQVFLIFIWLAFYWITFVWGQRDAKAGVLLVSIGLAIILYPAIQLFVPGAPFLIFSYTTFLSFTGIFISTVGMLCLISWFKAKPQEQ